VKKFDVVFVKNQKFHKEQVGLQALCEEVCSALSLFDWHECAEDNLSGFMDSSKPVLFLKTISSMEYFTTERKFSKSLSVQMQKKKPLPCIAGCCYLCFNFSESSLPVFNAENDLFPQCFDRLADYSVPSGVMFFSDASYHALKFQLASILVGIVQAMENLEELLALSDKLTLLEKTVSEIKLAL
jgi:hypothetical protein